MFFGAGLGDGLWQQSLNKRAPGSRYCEPWLEPSSAGIHTLGRVFVCPSPNSAKVAAHCALQASEASHLCNISCNSWLANVDGSIEAICSKYVLVTFHSS